MKIKYWEDAEQEGNFIVCYNLFVTKSFKTSGFTPILILLIVLILGGIGFVAYSSFNKSPNTQILQSPTPLPSTNRFSVSSKQGWKKYTNLEQGFSIELPQGYIVDDKTFTQSVIIYSHEKMLQRKLGPIEQDELKIEITSPQKSSGQKTYKSLQEFIYETDHDSGLVVENISWIKVTNEEIPKEIDGNRELYYLLNNGLLYHVVKKLNDSSLGEEFDQILSTFEFTENSASTPIGEKYMCQTDADCVKYNTCSEECVNKGWLEKNLYKGPACGIPWQTGCSCINNACISE